jgi:hypothetical protein
MSETTTEATPAPESTPAPEPAATAAPETEATTQEPELEAAPKPKQGDRRFAIMTAKLKAEEVARAAAERRAEAAEALANAGKDTPPRRAETPDIETAAARLVQQREFDARRQSVIAAGQKEFSDWAEKTDILHGLGATSNPAFMEALVELPNAAKVVAHLADDADAVEALLRKSPAAMAAALGRMDAEVSRPATRALSSAPKPVTPVTTPAVVAEPDAYDEKLSMKDYVALRAKTAPRHLGGIGRR